jgi:hypothetical protein
MFSACHPGGAHGLLLLMGCSVVACGSLLLWLRYNYLSQLFIVFPCMVEMRSGGINM